MKKQKPSKKYFFYQLKINVITNNMGTNCYVNEKSQNVFDNYLFQDPEDKGVDLGWTEWMCPHQNSPTTEMFQPII